MEHLYRYGEMYQRGIGEVMGVDYRSVSVKKEIFGTGWRRMPHSWSRRMLSGERAKSRLGI